MDKKIIRYLSLDDFQNFIDSIEKHPVYQSKKSGGSKRSLELNDFKLFCKLMFFCALNVSEVLALQKSDFDLENKILRIKRRDNFQQTTIPPNLIHELSNFLKYSNDVKLFKTTRQTVWTLVKKIGQFTNFTIESVKKSRSVAWMYPNLFRLSYRQLMLNNNADEDLADLKVGAETETQYGNYTLEDLKNWEKKFFKFTFFTTDEILHYEKWYQENVYKYERLSKTVENILKTILIDKNIVIQSITSRAKKIDDFTTKIKDGVTFMPKEMQDLAGIRIICYVKSDVEKISKIIAKNFEIDHRRSRDKSQILQDNQLGYLSVHYVANLPKIRTTLEDFKIFDGLFFEIQVRTILQHAWAEIQHDRMYKNPNLSKHLKRRYFLVAGILEMADNEFQTLYNEEKPNSD